jgi:hypothetical protein
MISIGDQNIRYIINSSLIQRSCLIDLTGVADSAVINITMAEGPMGAWHRLDHPQVEALRVAGAPCTITVTAKYPITATAKYTITKYTDLLIMVGTTLLCGKE